MSDGRWPALLPISIFYFLLSTFYFLPPDSLLPTPDWEAMADGRRCSLFSIFYFLFSTSQLVSPDSRLGSDGHWAMALPTYTTSDLSYFYSLKLRTKNQELRTEN